MDKFGLGDSAQKVSGSSILVSGKNTYGYTGDCKDPEFEFEEVDGESIGIVKRPKITIEICNLGAEFITHIASGLPFVLKKNISEDGENKPVVTTIQGDLLKMSEESKVGDIAKRTFEINLNMYSQVVDKIPTITYARQPYKCFFGAIDTAPKFNDNL
jgi:hypothetical protein